MALSSGRSSRSEDESQLLVGDFRLKRLIARSGMAILYEALQVSSARRVALKLIAPDRSADASYRERFLGEARAAMQIEHPNVVPVYDAGEADGHLFIAMRLIEGADLEQIIASEQPLPAERVLGLLQQIAAGLDAAHAGGLIHGDVKPANVMVERRRQEHEHCFLVDFGLAVEQDASSSITSTGRWAGTAAYISPEQLRGEPAGVGSDLYAFGALAFQALAGHPPYPREHDSGTLLAHLHAPPPSLAGLRPDLPPAVDRVFARALAKVPDVRHASARDLARDLARALAGGKRPPAQGTPSTGARSGARPGNLPVESSSFVGRRAELAAVRDALNSSRLVSVVGPGGVGKTALALHLVAGVESDHAGTWVIGLDSVEDGAEVELALARTLGLRIDSRDSLRAALTGFIEQRPLLLLLDSCEHVLPVLVPLVGELLRACGRLKIIATSREALAIDGESVCALGPLEVPDAEDEPQDILASDSAGLLLRRAGEQGISLNLGGSSPVAIARICERLDGIPLALELAAARLRTLSLDDLAERLQRDLRVLGAGGGPDRQRSLDGLIEWSWRLLGPDEQAVLARLAVFAGPFTLDAAEAVVSAAGGAPPAVGPLLLGLADKSLIQVEATRTQTRLRMLQPVREFCLAKLIASQRQSSARAAHRRYFLALCERAQPALDTAQAPDWLAALDEGQANIRAAIDSGLQEDHPEEALRIGVAMHPFWACRGLAAEGIDLLEGILRRAPSAPRALRGKAHSAVAHLAAGLLGDARSAEPHALEALRLARSSGDAETAAETLVWLAWNDIFGGRPADGLTRAEEGLAGAIEDPKVLGRLLDARGLALTRLDDPSAAEMAYARAREVFADAGYTAGVALVENHRGDLDLSTGDFGGAAQHFSLAKETAEAAGDGGSVAMAALNLALIDCLEGRGESARELFVDSLITNQACGDLANVAFSIFGLALTEPRESRAAELHGASAQRLAELDIVLSPLEERLRVGELERLRAGLGPAGLARALQRGRGLLIEDILDAVDSGYGALPV
jgi:non-specific serine/threonine protein kinase